MWWSTPASPALGRWGQENLKFGASLPLKFGASLPYKTLSQNQSETLGYWHTKGILMCNN